MIVLFENKTYFLVSKVFLTVSKTYSLDLETISVFEWLARCLMMVHTVGTVVDIH
jgi:hypothetical protein